MKRRALLLASFEHGVWQCNANGAMRLGRVCHKVTEYASRAPPNWPSKMYGMVKGPEMFEAEPVRQNAQRISHA